MGEGLWNKSDSKDPTPIIPWRMGEETVTGKTWKKFIKGSFIYYVCKVFQKTLFLPPDTHICVSGGKKC